ncbi:hypothetical protein Acor_14430 [Acrocarpospora corrugata]|uniref:Uncharacterized protein n=1 Tax=Acrocarpospora corrugata TaxID=35763 RepID=A0A5M3VU04_9ACTN|nr:hypothetical protein [Acrocarpospora corrugata]GER99379.1 hypothetical protein Acor_14430 [Acrocarpospora corrugata]
MGPVLGGVLLLCSCSSEPESASFSNPIPPAAAESTAPPAESDPPEPIEEETDDGESLIDEESTPAEDPEETEDEFFGGTYTVTISGVAGWTEFTREGTVTIQETIAEVGTNNGVNPIDVCLVSGMPAGLPEVGAIWFASNSGCIPGAGAAQLDMAYVEVDGSTVTVQPDERIAATLSNNFTVNDDYITSSIFAPVSGQMTITTDADGDLSGSIAITGYSGMGTATYQAEISGQRA